MSDMKQPPDSKRDGQETSPAASVKGLRVYNSKDLFESESTIGIEHDGALYQLKITRQGKLILNK